MTSPQIRIPRTQRGASTLLIAMLLLAILTVVTVFATAVGVSEQRTSANEYRHKLAFQAAEAGLNQAIEFLRANTSALVDTASGGWLFAGSPRWQPCTSALPSGMAFDPCTAEPDADRRSGMYRYVGATAGILPLSTVLPGAVNQTFTQTGGTTAAFATTYSTYATLCRIDMSTGVPRCSLDPSDEATFYVTVVSSGNLTNETASATVKQSFGTFRLLGRTPDAPLIAAGFVSGLGNAQIVPNANGGGAGVPISIWSQGDAQVAAGGSFSTCQLGEWLASDADNPIGDANNGVCADCTCNGLCPGYGLLSGSCPSQARAEGEDVLDVDGHVSNAVPALRDSKWFPSDLFQYVFGVPSSTATSYLTQYATQIADCSVLNASSSGLYWFNSTAQCSLGQTVGSVAKPVVLVSGGEVRVPANGQFFGIVYVRAGTGDRFWSGGGGQVYGSVIVEGDGVLRGTPTIVYNRAVLRNVGNSDDFVRYGPIPGSWSDSVGN